MLELVLVLADELKARIAAQIRTYGSAAHVPSAMFHVDKIACTLGGEEQELPVRKPLLALLLAKWLVRAPLPIGRT
ncbi:hypothetical protein TSA1_05920 [Bradyrhizobium nitroreducens]|uniref:Uncharacterized protein n=1 Tax=Bradyrhizobium nitroreducens TaxID=709803 RepID=A0A2M6U6Y7_9BRAD|nr:hypothetical protein TSA1_05920 [Bradyrhizobium nitroreducens]